MEPVEIREFRCRIGRAIHKLRVEESISAQFLAKVLGVTQPTISRIEAGTSSITADLLCFLAKAFNRPLSFFVGERSPVSISEEDILRAGLVHYGARHLKAKRTIDVATRWRGYADFLNDALREVEDPRVAAALATTLYWQAGHGDLNSNKILSTIQNKRLLNNLACLVDLILSSVPKIRRPQNEINRLFSRLKIFKNDLQSDVTSKVDTKPPFNVNVASVVKFINESFGDEE